MEKLVGIHEQMEGQLCDMFCAEMQLSKVLAKISSKATDPRLKQIVEEYKEKNDEQIFHFKQAFNLLYSQNKNAKCDVIDAMLKEAIDITRKNTNHQVIDRGLINVLQQVVQYQLTGFKIICNYAETLGFYDVAKLLKQNLNDGKEIDRKLANLAKETGTRKIVSITGVQYKEPSLVSDKK